MNSHRRSLLLLALAAPWAGLSSAASNKPANRKVKMVKLQTNFGPIILELDAKAAPETVANFLQYVKDGHYDGTIFHRVIDGFMIQGGGFTADMEQKATRAQIQNEAQNGLKNVTYSIAMARTPDPHSASSQFFINVGDNAFLDFRAPNAQGFGYCVFGKVTEGQDIVDRIRKVRTGNRAGHQDVPVENVIIEHAEIIEG
jgi:peptidyl-prolyl cis-trans isomerase B (cyclophilin B)